MIAQRQFCSQNISPEQVLGFPGILAEVEKRVRDVLVTAHDIELEWQWQDADGVWHRIRAERVCDRVKAGLVIMVRCVGVEKT